VTKPSALDFAWPLKFEDSACLDNIVEGCITDAWVAIEYGRSFLKQTYRKFRMISNWKYFDFQQLVKTIES
jgi:hypothetical protein